MRTIRDTAPMLSRDRYISPEYVNRWAWQIEQKKICLHPEDAISVKLWIERLKDKNINIFLKDNVTAPSDSIDSSSLRRKLNRFRDERVRYESRTPKGHMQGVERNTVY